jgi:two-component system sensor histidine kinase UhpB
MGAALVLVATMRDAAQLVPGQEAALVERLRATQGERWRHLRLTLRDAQGRVVFASREPSPAPWLVAGLVALLRQLAAAPDPAPLAWSLTRAEGLPWTLVLSPSAEIGRREAAVQLLQTLGLVGAGALLLLGLMRWQLHRAFRPMRLLVAAIGAERVQMPMPPMPVRELQLIAEALTAADAQRRLLAQRLQSLQEDERRRLAQELHDELGQRLTALRMDMTVLRRALEEAVQPVDAATRARLAATAADLSAQIGQAQQEVRELLARLAPRTGERASGERLSALLESLARAQRGLEVQVKGPHPEAELTAAAMLAVYRLSQEGLTNVVRHAKATRAFLSVSIDANGLHWRLSDNGVGVPDVAAAFERGSGLAGMRERAWALGGDLRLGDAGPGLVLDATLRPEEPEAVSPAGRRT